MNSTFELIKREDNSAEEAEKLVAWVRKVKGADAHIVFDYIPMGDPERGPVEYVIGALNGVTVQWDHDDDGVADGAIHVRPGGVVTRLDAGFSVEYPDVTE